MKLNDLLNINFYKKLKDLLESNNKKTLNKRHSTYFHTRDKELLTGIVVCGLILLILFAICYYFLVFSPQMEELQTQKNIKTNEVNEIFKDSDNIQAKQSIIAQIDSATSIEEVQAIDVNALAYPILKSQLLTQLNDLKDQYNRVELDVNGTKNIMTIENASGYINSSSFQLKDMSIHKVDSVIIPLSINRKQAASGLITVGDVVDIYRNNQQLQSTQEVTNDSESNDTSSENLTTNTSQDSSKLVGGATVVSILRSKDSGSINYNLELNEYPNSRNLSQTNSIDVEEVLSSKAVGTLDESQLNLLLSEYGTRLSSYERTSNIGNLDVEYIIMVEVPRDSVTSIISNMDNIILTIPTYAAPSWINLTI